MSDGEATIALVIDTGVGFFVRVQLAMFRGDDPDLPFAALAVKSVR